MVGPVHFDPNKPQVQQTGSSSQVKKTGTSFAEVLAQQSEELRFSNHAQKRLESRDIEMNDDRIARLNTAIDKAKSKGSRDSLILMDDLAFIVNVKENLVVTTVDMNNQKSEGVFTQIDSVVIAPPAQKNESEPKE